jgi:hypothetical protein
MEAHGAATAGLGLLKQRDTELVEQAGGGRVDVGRQHGCTQPASTSMRR